MNVDLNLRRFATDHLLPILNQMRKHPAIDDQDVGVFAPGGQSRAVAFEDPHGMTDVPDYNAPGGAGPLECIEAPQMTGRTISHYRILEKLDRKSTRLNSSHIQKSRMPSSA